MRRVRLIGAATPLNAEAEIERLTADMAQYEKIKRFALLPADFTFADGEMTYTLKLRRRKIEERYREIIDRLYDGEAEPHPHPTAP